ncbi:MAG: hypothetical protein R3B13_39390 [Polyangiaceae bacterium]
MARQSVSHRAVFTVFFGLIAAALISGALLYFGKLRYVPKAAGHAPADALVVVRVSVEKVGTFDPVRNQLMPLVDKVGEATTQAAKASARRDRFKSQAKLEFNVDLREVVLAAGPGRGDWVLVFGGMFARAKLVDGIGAVLQAEGRPGRLQDGVWRDDAGFVLAQAEDGCVVLASSEARLALALPAMTTDLGAADLELRVRPGSTTWLRGHEFPSRIELDGLRGDARAEGSGLRLVLPGQASATSLQPVLTDLGATEVRPQGDALSALFAREGLNQAAARLAAWLEPRLGIPDTDVGRSLPASP